MSDGHILRAAYKHPNCLLMAERIHLVHEIIHQSGAAKRLKVSEDFINNLIKVGH